MKAKRLLGIMISLALLLTLVPITASAVDDVPYIDATGTPSSANSVTEITQVNIDTINNLDGWYIVKSGATLTRSTTITVTGTAHLILENGCDLTVTGDPSSAGIKVSTGNSLTIYAQSTGFGMGKLTATGGGGSGSGGAGIGGDGVASGSYDVGGAGGSIIINGGEITANGGGGNTCGGAGIGGGGGSGSPGAGGNISISGGEITATGGSGAGIGGAGIGGGGGINGGAGGNINITGGEITATGGGGVAR